MYRFCILAGLLAVAWAQSGEPDGQMRFQMPEAVTARENHHYCLGYNETINDFPTDTWTIFIQFPLLSFLDTSRRTMLLRNIAQLIIDGSNNDARLSGFNESMICVGRYESYRLSYYEESVLVQLYTDPQSILSSADANTYFMNGFNSTSTVTGNLVRMFSPDFSQRRAIALDYEQIRGGPTTNVHPRRNVDGLNAVEDDPTLNAIVLGSWPMAVSIESALAGMTQEFAQNPDPINYGLTGGDIVFAIIGSILCAVVMGLVILGFCIHPFYLS